MTWVKSRLVRPDGAPVVGQCVTATLRTRPSWLRDHTGQASGVVRTNTDSTGLWRMNLLPHTDLEAGEFAFYEINEGKDLPRSYIRVPHDPQPGREYWMRDLLVGPPLPHDPQWNPITTLGRLHNVDGDADLSPPGRTLVSGATGWGTAPFALASLFDVDHESLAGAQPGAQLVMLPSGKWGVFSGPFHLAVEWDADDTYPSGVWVTVHGAGPLGARVNWGDGTPAVDVMPDEPVRHVYPPGEATYKVVARDKAYPLVRGETTVVLTEHVPVIHPYLDGEDDWRVLLWVDEPADGTQYLVDWGDGTDQIVNGQARVPPLPRVPHQYDRIGRWTLSVKNLTTKRTTRTTVDTGDVGVVFQFDKGPYQPRLHAMWLAKGSVAEIDNDDGTPPVRVQVPPSGHLNVLKDAPMAAGSYHFRLSELVGGTARRITRRIVTIPNQWDWGLSIWMAWRRDQMTDDSPGQEPVEPDPTRQTVRVQAQNARVACDVSWGDGTPDGRLTPGSHVEHEYMLPMPASGLLLRVSEDTSLLPSGAHQRVFSRLLGEPRYIGFPVLNARSNGAVDLDIAGIEGETNSDWYQVRWGDGSTVEQIGAIGRWFPANHTYAAEGTYTITVDGPGMPVPITRTVKVVYYPAPTLTATEDVAAGDPQHLTALLTVDNRASGGPALVYFGDGSPPAEVPETGSVSHRYPDPGPGTQVTYHAVAESKADATAKGRKLVTVPYVVVPPSTITFEVAPYSTNLYAAQALVTEGNAQKRLVIDWGDGSDQGVQVGVPAYHTYRVTEQPQIYTVLVGYDDGSETTSRDVTIPFTSGGTS